MKDYNKAVCDVLSKNGCYFVRHGKGDHDRWHSPITNRNITVDGTIPSRHMANEVLKQAGIKKQF
jgi:predicted RNA binding protein YcfA (HicA-like mRNA interferase family)